MVVSGVGMGTAETGAVLSLCDSMVNVRNVDVGGWSRCENENGGETRKQRMKMNVHCLSHKEL